jgi:heme A synthase
MSGMSMEFILMLGYAISLAFIALLLELAARHAHRRSLSTSTAGFTYHPERDVWRCPRDQHLFPVFSDSVRGVVVYRAPAAACNSCPSKAACTDSDRGREIGRRDPNSVEFGMKRFHRLVSITLLLLASLILVVELFRTGGLYPRIVLIAILALFCAVVQRLCANISQRIPERPNYPRHHNDLTVVGR